MARIGMGDVRMAHRVGIIVAHVVDNPHAPCGRPPQREAVIEEVYRRLWANYDQREVEAFTDRTRVRAAVDMAFEMEGLE